LAKSSITDEPRADCAWLSLRLSRQIQDLEKELGCPLFDRLPRGVKSSAAGKLFLEDVRRIVVDVILVKCIFFVFPESAL
jgi:hypothetical protein